MSFFGWLFGSGAAKRRGPYIFSHTVTDATIVGNVRRFKRTNMSGHVNEGVEIDFLKDLTLVPLSFADFFGDVGSPNDRVIIVIVQMTSKEFGKFGALPCLIYNINKNEYYVFQRHIKDCVTWVGEGDEIRLRQEMAWKFEEKTGIKLPL